MKYIPICKKYSVMSACRNIYIYNMYVLYCVERDMLHIQKNTMHNVYLMPCIHLSALHIKLVNTCNYPIKQA